jgi:hypothetical protein
VGDHGHRPASQFEGKRWQLAVYTVRPTIFDHKVLSFGEAGLAQTAVEPARLPVMPSGDPLSRNPITGAAGSRACKESGCTAEQRK